MANFSANIVTAVQAALAPLGTGPQLLQYLGTLDIIGGAVVNSSGVITIGGRALSNAQYEQLYEMIQLIPPE